MKDKKEKKDISRRDFLKGAAAGTVGAAAIVSGASAFAQSAGEAARSGTVFNMPRSWDHETDFLVVGTGTAM